LDDFSGEDDGLRAFRNVCRLFPLAGVVLFPHSVLPLHIFEPRYRQMTADALASDGLVTIVQPRPPDEEPLNNLPPLESVACLGKIIKHERLPDGRYNFLLLGLKRVRLIREVATKKLYRTAEAELLEDEPSTEPEEPRRSELIELFRAIGIRQDVLDPDLATLLDSALPLGALTDVVAHALGLPPGIKQAFLDDRRADRRADGLIEILRQVVDRTPGLARELRTFPPPFSAN
jgi:Lon protease-like protein